MLWAETLSTRRHWLHGSQMEKRYSISEAIVPEMGKDKIFLYKSGKAQPVEIQTGIRTEAETQVLQGLQTGDTIIISGTLQLRTGLPVTLDNIYLNQVRFVNISELSIRRRVHSAYPYHPAFWTYRVQLSQHPQICHYVDNPVVSTILLLPGCNPDVIENRDYLEPKTSMALREIRSLSRSVSQQGSSGTGRDFELLPRRPGNGRKQP